MINIERERERERQRERITKVSTTSDPVAFVAEMEDKD